MTKIKYILIEKNCEESYVNFFNSKSSLEKTISKRIEDLREYIYGDYVDCFEAFENNFTVLEVNGTLEELEYSFEIPKTTFKMSSNKVKFNPKVNEAQSTFRCA